MRKKKALFIKNAIFSLITSLLLVFPFSCRPREIEIPEPPSDRHQPYNFVGRRGMVVAAHHLAAKAGLEMLKKGGNAIDAMVTTAFALNASEPFASGIGGGGFMIIYLASENRVTVVDFREKAPSRVPREIFNDEGRIKPDGLAVAVPSALAGWVYSLKKYGTKSLTDVTQEAIRIAENGFEVSQTFSRINKDQYEKILTNAGEGTCYLNKGFPYEPGDLFRNPELASTLKLIASKGIDEFYKGEIAQKVVKAVNEKGGVMDLKDLALYKPVEHPPLKGIYKDYTLFTIPPPSSGGVHMIQLLNIIENWPVRKWGRNSSPYIHHFCEALRFVFADRSRYLGDPDFIKIPVEELISKKYAKQIVSQIKPNSLLDVYPFGRFDERKNDQGNTSHVCVIDKKGNIVSLTHSINHFFGTGIVPENTGFLLNNIMYDFSDDPSSPNALGPYRRPLSSMGPLIMFKKDKPFLILGSPGGTRIFSSLTQIIINIIDFNMSLDEAIEAPRFFTYSSEGKARSISLESRFPEKTIETLKNMGHSIRIREAFDKYFGGSQGILILEDKKLILGGADSRRDGYGAGY
ncbi:MAG: gamma-glutamyltransferase [Candidatus Aminicenantes bacterium]|nr:gamma-glutamyltransferase [Candidatus Aminicenantes bacterium]